MCPQMVAFDVPDQASPFLISAEQEQAISPTPFIPWWIRRGSNQHRSYQPAFKLDAEARVAFSTSYTLPPRLSFSASMEPDLEPVFPKIQTPPISRQSVPDTDVLRRKPFRIRHTILKAFSDREVSRPVLAEVPNACFLFLGRVISTRSNVARILGPTTCSSRPRARM